nr:immunoglobulin heavy chain junction region [Macaca mulatta]MOX68212.1 immunoglobulin heavy chain junction region [Macaca mulatta]
CARDLPYSWNDGGHNGAFDFW